MYKSKFRFCLALIFFITLIVATPNEVVPQNTSSDVEDTDKPNELDSSIKDILEKSSKFELLSISESQVVIENENGVDNSVDDQDGYFYGHAILGSIIITDKKVKKKLLLNLYKGIKDFHGMGACFNPRHGIRASLNGDVVDLVICFECVSIDCYKNKMFVQELSINYKSGKVFNKVLKAHNIPLSR